jgi:hypothetical protein
MKSSNPVTHGPREGLSEKHQPRKVQAFQLVRESKGTQATPSGWKDSSSIQSKSAE